MSITVAMRTEISQLYVSLFGRAPDGEGLGFWVSSYSKGNSLANIAQSMYDTAPARAYYPLFATPSEIVTTFYTNVLGRAPDAEGLAFWVKEYSAAATQGAFFSKLISNVVNYNGTDAAGVTSKSLFANKVAVAQYYGEQNGTVAGATAALTGVTSVAASVDTAKAAILNTTGSGQTFTLTASTTSPDDFTGSALADVFNASLGRLQSDDALNGAGGNDVLNASLGATVTTVIASIETVNITATSAASLDGANITGATNVNVSGGNTLTYLAQDGEAFSVDGASTGLTVTRSATDTTTDAITVSLKNGKAGSVSLGDAGIGADYETVNLVIAGAGSATITEADGGGNQTDDGWAESTDKIVVTGSGDYTLNIADALLGGNGITANAVASVIDASGHTGTLTVNLGITETAHVDVSKFTGVDIIQIETDDTGDIVANSLKAVASGTIVHLTGVEAADNTLLLTPNGSATTDAVTLRVGSATAGTSLTLANVVTDGFETLTIESAGTSSSSSTVKNVINGLDGLSTDTKLILSGSTALDINAVEATFTNITVTNTAGADVAIDTGGAVSFTGGAGKDRFEFDTVADLTTADTVVGGDERDTLAFSAVPSLVSAAQLARVTGFEAVEFVATNIVAGNFTLDISANTGMDTVIFTGELTTDSAKQITIKANSGLRVEMGGHTATGGDNDDLIVSIVNAANAGTNDTVTLALANIGADDAHAGLHIDNVENFVIELAGDASHIWTIADVDGAQLSTITVKSTNTTAKTASDALVVTAVETTMATLLDATAMTGALTFQDESAFSALGATLKGGSGVDTLNGGVGADVIQGNAGNDVLNGAAGNDNIDGGAGADNINGDANADVMTGGTGADVFVIDKTESTEAAMDSITDFKAIAADQDFDTLDLTNITLQGDVTIGNAVDVKAGTADTDTDVKAYITTGIMKLTGAEAANVNTLAEWFDVAEIMLNAGAGADAVALLAFEFNGDTYLVGETYTHIGTISATDQAVKLVGVTGITGLSTTEAANVIHLT